MKKNLNEILEEQIALLEVENTPVEQAIEEEVDVCEVLASNEEDENQEPELDYDTALVDFDFDREAQTDFDVFMNMRYFWIDWNPVYTDIH